MSSLSRLGSFSTPNLQDTRDIEVKSRRNPYDQSVGDSRHEPPRVPEQGMPAAASTTAASTAAAANMGKARAVQLRRSVSMRTVRQTPGSGDNQAEGDLQQLLKQLNSLNACIAGIRFKPDERRRQLRREIMMSRVDEFTLDKALERILFAVNKTKNELRSEEDRCPDEAVFRESVELALQFGKSAAPATSYAVLKSKNKNRHGMRDAAAVFAAGAGMLALPVAQAVHRLTPSFIRRGRDMSQHRAALAGAMKAPQAETRPRVRAGQSPAGGVDIDALFRTPRESMATDSGQADAIAEANSKAKTPAEILARLGKIVEERGAPAALAEMDIDDAVVLAEFKGGITHLKSMMGPQSSSAGEGAWPPVGRS